MSKLAYFEEALGNSLCERTDLYGQFTKEQLQEVAEDLMNAAEMWSEYSGEAYIPNPVEEELGKVKKELKLEKSKVSCPQCAGRGRIYTPGPYHGSDSECWKCNGEGKIIP